MDALIWLSLPLFVAAGSAMLCYFIMQAKMEAMIAGPSDKDRSAGFRGAERGARHATQRSFPA